MTAPKLGLTVVVACLFPWVGMAVWSASQQKTWMPLTYPLQLRTGLITSPEFTTGATAEYYILLVSDGRISRVVDMSWLMLTNGSPSGSGSSGQRTAAYRQSDDETALLIGRFNAREGERHVILLDVKGDAQELVDSAPRLVVEIDPMIRKGGFVLWQLAFLGAVLVCGIGILLRTAVRKFSPKQP